MPLPLSNPKRIPRAMSAEPENIDDPTWAENDIATIPPVIAFASDMNKFAHQVTDSIRYLRETSVMVSDFRAANSGFPTNSVLLGLGLRWQPGVGFNKATQGDIFLCNGKRLDLFTQSILNIAGITNHTFPPNTRVWVYASGTYLDRISQVGGQGTTLPAAPPLSVDLYFHDVGAGNPPVVPVGYFIVGGVNTNGTGIVSNIDFSTFPAPFNLQSGIIFDAINFYINGSLEIGSNLIVQGSSTFSDEVNVNSTLNANDTLNVQNLAHFFGDVIVDATLTVALDSYFNNVEISNDLVVGGNLSVDLPSIFYGAVTFNGIVTTNALLNVDGDMEVGSDSEFNGLVDFNGIVSFNQTVDFNNNVTISAINTALDVDTTSTSGVAIQGRTAALATSASSAIAGIAFNNGVAGNFSSVNGYGVVLTTSGTTRPALRMSTQAADPSTLSTGDIWWRTTGPKFRLGTNNRFFWGTPEGMFFAKKSDTSQICPGGGATTIIVTSNLVVPALNSVLVTARLDIDIPASTTVNILLKKDGVTLWGSTISSAGVTPLSLPWSITDYVSGSIASTLTIEVTNNGAANATTRNAILTVLGTVLTSEISLA